MGASVIMASACATTAAHAPSRQRTWTETSPAIRPKAALTERARVWACRRVGEDGVTVEDVRLELGVG